MSTTKSPQTGFTRRTFLKTTGALAGVAAVGAAATPELQALAVNYGTGQLAGSDEKICSGVCRPNCFAYCHLNIHVREGNITKVSMAEFGDKYLNRICLRGLSHVQRTYDPQRVKYPMRRVGERGSNEWERISWDEALAEVADKFTGIQKTYGPQALSFYTVSGNMGLLHGGSLGIYSLLKNAVGATLIGACIDNSSTVGVNRVAGNMGPWVCTEPKQMVKAKSVVIWGNNLTEAQLQEWHAVAEAKEAGVKIVVIDPTFTHIAAKADLWVPIRPASDAALALSIMNVILSEKGEDEDFLKKHTCAPFLVRPDNGKFIHMSDLGTPATQGPVNPMTGQPTIIDPCAAWDPATGAAALAETVADPALTGTFQVAGVACRTAFDLLKEEIAKYPPSEGERLTEVPADTIRELAKICMNGPVYHRVGYGPQAYDNGVHTAHAGMTLCALTGNLGKEGSSWGSNWNMSPGINFMAGFPIGDDGMPIIAMTPTIATMQLRETMRSGKFMGMDYPIKAMLIYSGNPLSTAVDANEFKRDVFDNLEYICTIDNVLSDTVRYSDMVLPCAGWFEVEDVIPGGQSHYIQYTEKAIEPLYESKSDADIVRALADKMGVGKYFKMTDEEWLTNILTSDYHKMFHIDFPTLKKMQAMRYFQDPFIAWEGGKFLTPSGRLEFYLEDPQPSSQQGVALDYERERLPRFFPPAEAWPENPLYEKYPFVCMSERPRYRVHSQWFSNPWLRELDPEPLVKLNPIDAEAKGLKTGDYAECFNDRGHCVAKLVVSDAVRPKTIVYPKNWQMYQHKAGSWSELSSSSYDAFGVNQSFMDVLADVRAWKGAE
ncbi:MAG: molybdopterin-dependent oxidoreductase [Raoultibacter sp.]